jgi:hypothetical protein
MISETTKTTLLGIIICLTVISLLFFTLLVKSILHARRIVGQNMDLPNQNSPTNQSSIQHPPPYTSYPTTQEVRIPAHGDEPPDYYGRTNRASQLSISSASEQSVIFIDHISPSTPESPTHSTSSDTLYEHPSELQSPNEAPPTYGMGTRGLRQSVDSAREFYASFYATEIHAYRRITPPLLTSYPIPQRLSASLITNHSHGDGIDVESQGSSDSSQWTFGTPIRLEGGSGIAEGAVREE